MQIEPKKIKNILAVRNDRFGEFLLNIPALRALRENFTHAKIIVVVNSYVKELAECIPFIDEIIQWDMRRHNFLEKLKFIGLLKRRNINMAVMLNPSKEFNIFTYLAGIPVRVGYNRKCGFLLTHKIEDKKYLGQRHEVEYNLELVGLVGAETKDSGLNLTIDGNVVNNLLKYFNINNNSRLIALHPWTSDSIKQWPQDNFCALAKKLTKELNIKVIVIGGKEELGKSIELFSSFNDNLINITGRTTLKQLAALLKECKLLISGDSGPVHLACAVGTPVIAIFRNDIPAKSARRWGPWGEGHTVIEKNNLRDITVDEVFNKAKEALNR